MDFSQRTRHEVLLRDIHVHCKIDSLESLVSLFLAIRPTVLETIPVWAFPMDVSRSFSNIHAFLQQKIAFILNNCVSSSDFKTNNLNTLSEGESRYHQTIDLWLKQTNKPQRKKMNCRTYAPANIQISLRNRAVWSESSLGTFWIVKDAKFLHAENEASN